MILEELKHAVSLRVREWAKDQPELAAGAGKELPFTQPPAHVPADLSFPWPLQAAKLLKRKPLDVAGDLAKAFGALEGVEPPQPSPPGFVNFRLTSSALSRNLARISREPATYGANARVRARSILIEFVSANPTGPLHLASGRAATLGDSLVRVLRRIGHKVGAEYYINDAGGRAEILGQSLKARHEQARGKDVQVPEGGYQGEYLKDMAADLPAEAAGWKPVEFGKWAMNRLIAQHKEDMASFGAGFDRWFLESELHDAKAVEQTLAWLKERKMAYEKDGATWLGTSGVEGADDDKDRVLVKSDGKPTYFLADIAYHKNKFDRGWGELIDILGADHHGYVPRMKAAVAAMGKPPEAFHAIVHQLVHLFKGQEAVKMSKRAGEFVTLRELVADVGRDACRFFFAQRTPNAHMNFDLELAKKRSNENPVFYVQYVHARICSIFREAQKADLAPPDVRETEALGQLLTQPEERALLVKLAWFPDALAACESALSPHPLPTYLLELAGLYHPFYEKCRVVDSSNKDLSRARLALCRGVKEVIAEGLELLGVSAPELM
ncbi:MAG: arginine--tRNA ligase [Elusimicrobia bacterium]|nr:arginine--tRNA ligase [Elusimicrobiota bacterium]